MLQVTKKKKNTQFRSVLLPTSQQAVAGGHQATQRGSRRAAFFPYTTIHSHFQNENRFAKKMSLTEGGTPWPGAYPVSQLWTFTLEGKSPRKSDHVFTGDQGTGPTP